MKIKEATRQTMKYRNHFLLMVLAILIVITANSCSTNTHHAPIITSTPVPATEVNVTPSTTPSVTPLPTAKLILPVTPVTPYPTANETKANAVAFISQENAGYSLWVANVDGSGERKLADIPYNRQDGDWGITSYYLQWSPDGKWISYIRVTCVVYHCPGRLDKKKNFLVLMYFVVSNCSQTWRLRSANCGASFW